MARKPDKTPTPPDGQPATKPNREDRQTVSEAQDPLIAGNADNRKRVEADEPAVDSAGQIARKPATVDLLH